MRNARPKWSIPNHIGLALTGIIGLINLPSAFGPQDPDTVGAPVAINIADSVLGAIALVAVIVAWITRNRLYSRVAAAAIILLALSAFPAFFSSVPAELKIEVAGITVLTVVTCVLLLKPSRKAAVAAAE